MQDRELTALGGVGHGGWFRVATWFTLAGGLWATGLQAQTPAAFTRAVEDVAAAWLAHDYDRIVETSDTVRLQLPGHGRSPVLRPSQAARVLQEYLKSANEIALVMRNPRAVSEDHVYAQMTRRYVVQGTSDERAETVFLGFRLRDGRWHLREVRVAP